ncbi:MAG: hypothetical protein QOF60_391 [Actinomycetota bacterium]|jgi:hypothetical protein|nr:hypothetical protein [Actinomycetota bacterium]
MSRPWLLAVVFLATGACAVPVPTARSAADYGKKAGHTAEDVHSAIETTVVALDNATHGRTLPTTLNVVVSDAEDDARGAMSTFQRIAPRGQGAGAIHDRLVPLLNDAADAITRARQLARRGQTSAGDVEPVTRRLAEIARALDDFANAQP